MRQCCQCCHALAMFCDPSFALFSTRLVSRLNDLETCQVMEIVAEDLAPKKAYSELVEMARDDQVGLATGL